jgi:type I restriction enzyme S subunit
MAEPIPEKEVAGAYELPKGWDRVILKDYVYIAARIGWRGLKRSEYTTEGPFFLAVKDIRDDGSIDYSDTYHLSEFRYEESPEIQLQEEDIIITKDGTIGKIGFIQNLPAKVTVNSSLLVVRPCKAIFPRFLFHYFRGPDFQSIVKERIMGSAVPHLFQKDIKKFLLNIPPLAEQHRITVKLEALLAQVNAAKDHLAAVPPIIKRFRQSVLAAACSGRLTEDWRREHPDVEPASELLKKIREERIRRYEEGCKRAKEEGRRKPRKPSNITQNEFAVEGLIALPNGWTWAALDDLSANEANSITDGPFGSKLKTEHYTESGPRVIRLQNIGDGKFIDAKAHISPHHFENLRKHEIFGGDIVIAALGTDLPRACIIPDYVSHAIVKADCIRFKPHPSITNNQYMNASLNSDILKHIAQSIVHGVGRPRLNQQQVKSLPIPLPPLSEQHAIVNRIETLFHRTSEVEERVATATAHADRLTQSILAKAFRGELVPQDPDDEPASVLLERIRKERTELEKKKKPQKRRSKTLSDSN